MHKRKMGHIQEILDGARPAGAVLVRAAVHLVKGWVVPLDKLWDILSRITQCDPNPVVFFLCSIDFCVCRSWRLLVRMRGKTDALPLFVVSPAVIWTSKAVVLNFPQRKTRSPMQANASPISPSPLLLCFIALQEYQCVYGTLTPLSLVAKPGALFCRSHRPRR